MFSKKQKIYMVGIKGAGMCALAQILQSRGMYVEGSDTEEIFFTDNILKNAGIKYKEGFNKDNLPAEADFIITSNAYIDSNNPEITKAKKQGLKILTYPEALAELFNNSHGIAVAGTHGKSTTTAMLAHILYCAGLSPTAVVGAAVNNWGSNVLAGSSSSFARGASADKDYFVIEADEYKDAFLKYKPKTALITNIDFDHPDYFKHRGQYIKSFQKFTRHLKEDNIHILSRKPRKNEFKLKLPGYYNQLNAALAYQAALGLGISPKKAHEALKNFKGLARRFESWGKYKGAALIDDYAHHPGEIKALIAGAKEKYKTKKLFVVFQPHTYSRTKGLFGDFCRAFSGVDCVYIVKTYGSAREQGPDIWGKKLAKCLDTKYFEDHEEAVYFLKNRLNSDKVLIAAGAGDQWRILRLLKK